MSKLIKSISNSIRRGYQAGISGDTYYDMMRQCTLKTMFEPSYELNRRVVECIIHESCGPVREAVRELKDRLQQENPFKAYLAVKLTEQVLDEAGEAVAVYTMVSGRRRNIFSPGDGRLLQFARLFALMEERLV